LIVARAGQPLDSPAEPELALCNQHNSLLSTFSKWYSLLLEFCVADIEGAPKVDDAIYILV
jgi:hypothetical protein